MYPDASEVSDAMHILLDRSLPTLEGMDLSLLNKVGSLAARKAPKWLIDPLARLAVSQMLAQKKEYSCQLTTVSNIIKTQVTACRPPLVYVLACTHSARSHISYGFTRVNPY